MNVSPTLYSLISLMTTNGDYQGVARVARPHHAGCPQNRPLLLVAVRGSLGGDILNVLDIHGYPGCPKCRTPTHAATYGCTISVHWYSSIAISNAVY
jgi:hypothetical protein